MFISEAGGLINALTLMLLLFVTALSLAICFVIVIRYSNKIGIRKSFSESQNETFKIFTSFFDNNHEPSLICDSTGQIIYLNTAIQKGFNLNKESLMQHPISILASNEHKPTVDILVKKMADLHWHWEGELWIQDGDLKSVLVRVIMKDFPEFRKSNPTYMITFLKVTERQHIENQINNLMNFDRLSGLPNRVHCIEFISNLIIHSRVTKREFAVIVLDIDNLKNINDALGPHVGDKLILSLAEKMKKLLHPNHYYHAHLGGDDFIIVLEQFSQSRAIENFISELQHDLCGVYEVEGNEVSLSVSCGVSTYPDGGDTAESLMKNAEIAMYYAKGVGRGTLAFYDLSMNKESAHRTSLEANLRKALERNESELHYQPIVELATKKVVGVEALIRWNHPTYGLMYPGKFISLAEQNGLIIPIGAWVAKQAIQDLCILHKQGYENLSVSINVSASQFRKGDVAAVIAEIIWESGVNAKKVQIELTESVVMEQPEKSLLMLNVLSSMGVRISIDDFGTGYSSLSHLRKLPINTLKIDGTFIHDIEFSVDDVVIVSTILSMARQLGLSVVAEGVETEWQSEFLLRQNCSHVQGNYFSVPLDFNTLLGYLKEHY